MKTGVQRRFGDKVQTPTAIVPLPLPTSFCVRLFDADCLGAGEGKEKVNMDRRFGTYHAWVE